MKLLIDYSVMCHGCWHIMKSPNYEARTSIEKAEFARNLAASMLEYTERFKPDEVVFAVDAKGEYWRHVELRNHYKKHCKVFKYLDLESNTEKFILTHDLKMYRLDFFDGPNKWIAKKLTVKEKEEAKALKLEPVKHKDIPEDIQKFIPSYKGNRRDSAWDYATTRAEWHVLCQKILVNLASTFKAKIFEVPKAEADDIAKVYADLHPAEEMVFITTDSDWSQLLIDKMFLKLYNPTQRAWVDKTAEQARFDLAVKIMSGDSSDNIAGIALKDANATMGKKTAEKLILTVGIGNIYKELEDLANVDQLYKNYEMIFLDNIPEKLKAKIKRVINTTSITKTKKPFPLSSYGVTAKDVLEIKGEAKGDRDVDLQEQRIEG